MITYQNKINSEEIEKEIIKLDNSNLFSKEDINELLGYVSQLKKLEGINS